MHSATEGTALRGAARSCTPRLGALYPTCWHGHGPQRRCCVRLLLPFLGPQDIQDSTQLWEALPAAVMDLALNLHNDCVRQLVRR